jgi:hypothetical protein
MKGTAPEVEPDKPDMPTDLTGEGTKEKPYTVADANRIIAALGNATSEVVYVKGKVSKIDKIEIEFGNATYFICDDEKGMGKSLEIYRGYSLNGEKFTKSDEIKAGDLVVVQGTIVNFKGTLEFTTGSKILSINGEGENPGGDTPTPTGDILNVSFESGQGDFTIDDKDLGSLTYVWKADTSKGYMKASAYANNAAESWLISPAFSLKNATNPVMTFNNACNFVKEGTITDHIKVMVYDGTNWAEATIASMPDGASWTFVDSTVDLKAYAGKENVKIAFKYVSTTAVAPTWEIKTVTIK